jgi:hypothetical protein
MHCSNEFNHQVKNEVYEAGKKEAEKVTDSSNVKLTRHKLR